MTGARRLLLVVALVATAVVPLRAFGGGGEPASGLSVEASLGGCGISESEIVCEIDVSFGGVVGADHYTASVTRADGTVQDAGTIGTGEGGSASVYVPYVGSGTYTVTVSAWGLDESGNGDSEPELLESGAAGAGAGENRDGGKASAEPAEPAKPDAAEAEQTQESIEPSPEGAPAPPETQKLPECQPEPDEAATDGQASEGAHAEADAAPLESAPPAPPIECTTPSRDSDGPCCPPAA